LNSINKLVFVLNKCCVFFDVWTELLDIIYMSFGSKELTLTLGGDEWSFSHPCNFTPGKDTVGRRMTELHSQYGYGGKEVNICPLKESYSGHTDYSQ
jgi:hypothetical protein